MERMRVLALAPLMFYCAIHVTGITQDSASQPNPQPKSPVVVELFTSEGCSDCPPADDLLSAMAQHSTTAALADLNIIPLSFHVTYWDEQGWHDRFDDARYTERQRDYQSQFHIPSIYTPQSVIDGQYETVGNSAQKVIGLIRRAAAEPKPVEVEISASTDSVMVTAHTTNDKATGKVLLAVTEDGLTTEVKAGENRSKTLHHNAVVRSLEDLGRLKNGAFSRTVSLKLKKEWQRDKLHLIVLVQENNGHVLGAGTTVLSSAATT